MAIGVEFEYGQKVGPKKVEFVCEIPVYSPTTGNKLRRRGFFICKKCGETYFSLFRYVLDGSQCTCKKCSWVRRGKLPYGHAARNRIYDTYKKRAKERGLCFKLSKEEFTVLTQKECVYCGCPPSSVYKIKEGNGEFIYNGVDRVDNGKGYTKENSVTCCGVCNKAKRDYSVDFFLRWAESVTNYQLGKTYKWWRGLDWAINLLSRIFGRRTDATTAT